MNSNIELEIMSSKSVWNVMMTIPKMKNGGILITNDDERIEVIKARLENNRVLYLQEDGSEGDIPLLSIKEARPLSLDHELPTRRDEAPIDDRDDEVGDFTPKFCIEFQGNDTIESRLSSRKDYKSYDIEFGPTPLVRCNAIGDIPPPSKLVRSQACDQLPKKRKIDVCPPTVQNTPLLEPSENGLLEFPELRPDFLEPLPVSPRNIKIEVEMIPKSEYNKLEDDFARLLKLMFKNNYSILQDACENDYKVKIRDSSAEQRVYSVMYTFENKEESFAVLVNEQDKTLHMNVQDIITVIPSISKEKQFYEMEPVNISNSDYWLFSTLNINDERVFIHKNTGIIVSINKEDVYFEAMHNDRNYSSEELSKITEWVKRCGIKVYEPPSTPIKKERRSEELRAPRKQKPILTYEGNPECARKLDFDIPQVRRSAELRAPRKEPSYLDLIIRSIKELKQRGGCSRPLLKEYIKRTFGKSESPSFERAIRQALKKGVEEGYLVQNKQSFKLDDKGKEYKEQKPEIIKEEEDVAMVDMIEFLKESINKTVKFNYKEQSKIVTVKSVDNYHLTGICNRDNHIKKYSLKYIYDIELVEDKQEKPDVKDAIKEAYKNKKTIFIKYSRGSIPDIKRPIRVIGFQKDLVIAECLIEGSIRNFKIEHIEIVA